MTANPRFSVWIKSFAVGETRKMPKGTYFHEIQDEGLRRWGYYFTWNRETNEVTRVCQTCLR